MRKFLPAALTAAFYSLLLSFGGMLCLVTAFSLDISIRLLLLCCGGCAIAGCLLFRLRHGGAILACILALLGGYLWRQGEFIQQTLQLCYRITSIYDRAYGFGYLGTWNASDSIVLPLCVLGGLIALVAAWCVTRRRLTLLAAVMALLPLGLCMVVTDTVPSIAGLFILLLGVLLLLLTQYVRRHNEAEGLRLTWLLSAPVALALALLFLAIPQSSYNKQSKVEALTNMAVDAFSKLPVVDISESGELSLSFVRDIPSQVNLQSIGPNTQFGLQAMEVTAESSGKLYLRGRHYDTYTGTQWQAAEGKRDTFVAQFGSPVYDSVYAGLERQPMGKLSIRTLGSRSAKYIPYYPGTPCYLQNGALTNPDGENTYTYQWYALPEDFESHVHYTVDDIYFVSSSTSFALEGATKLSTATRIWAVEYLQDNLSTDEFDNLFYTTICTAANTIAGLVRDSARYDLDTQRMPDGEQDFARWFLEQSDTGYCVHYATATAVLLRAIGIPSRYVEGYLTDAVAGETVTVTEKDAHAWVEYYIDGIGWIPLESTAAAAPGSSEDLPVWAPEPSAESTETTQAATVPPESTAASDETSATDPHTPTHSGKKSTGTGAPMLIAAVVIVVLLIQWPVRLILRRIWQNTGSPNGRGLKKWRHARRLARLLGQALPDDLAELALRCKFSQHTLTGQDLRRFDTFCTDAVSLLRQRPWWQQLYFRLIIAAY